MPPSFLYFDLGNVVLRFDPQIAVRQMAELIGADARTIHEIVYDSGLQTAYELGELATDQFYETICEGTGTNPDRDALLVAASDMCQLDEAVADLIRRVRSAGHRTGVLSNTCEAHWRFYVEQRFPVLRKLFDVAALSYELRALKPDPAIYQAAAALAGARPPEIFFVDDRPEHVDGARRVGFDAVLFTGADDLAAALAERGVRIAEA